MICKILGVFVNTMAAAGKYSLLIRSNFDAVNSDGII